MVRTRHEITLSPGICKGRPEAHRTRKAAAVAFTEQRPYSQDEPRFQGHEPLQRKDTLPRVLRRRLRVSFGCVSAIDPEGLSPWSGLGKIDPIPVGRQARLTLYFLIKSNQVSLQNDFFRIP
ncbi:hypothetical protein HNY73_011731 [Argiope bruennichi]|uniref:Uncharacterized protein n=1 Tax=Argiope bruennichi TaxID=94029 RepID=A0A8T0EZQ5_ARGBR|nr:hypothetical protein HNY73_011731 [Argiope bruennichi]